MENFFYEENFFKSLDEFCEYCEITKENVESYPDDYNFEIELTELSPFMKLTPQWIINAAEYFEEENLSEDCGELAELMKILEENIDFDKINSLMPKLYCGSGVRVFVTKKDLLELVDWD